VTLSEEQVLARRLLRLLLDEDGPDTGPVDWNVLLPLARWNGTLLRVTDRLAERAPAPPAPVVDAIATERRRARDAFALVRHVTRVCTKHGIEFLFAKAFQHYPDVGGDLDLLVLARAADVDALLARELPATAAPRDLSGRIAGSVAFRVRDVVTPLDVQHGRIGTVGEHRAYAVTLVRNRRRIVIEGTEFAVPCPEDQLVLQGAQRIYGRRSLRLCDVAYTVSSLRHDRLDWEYIVSTATRIGVLPGLGCYLGYVEQIHRELSGDLLVPTAVRDRLPLAGWGRIQFTRGAYRFPAVRVNGRLYLRQLVAGLRAANWDGAARLCLLPLVGAAVALGRVTTARSRSAGSA
jgi:hypothetical protein